MLVTRTCGSASESYVRCFGHVHDSSGVEERDGTIFVIAAICNRQYWPSNPVRVVDISR
jgi:Icc-related predicted phosphoesterase